MSLLTASLVNNTVLIKKDKDIVLAKKEDKDSFLVYSDSECYCLYESKSKEDAEKFFDDFINLE